MVSYLSSVLAHDLNKVGHGKVHDVVFPRQFQDNIGVEKVVALKGDADTFVYIVAFCCALRVVLFNEV